MKTIIKTVNEVYKKLPDTFDVWDIVYMTRRKSGRPFVTDGTVTRQLRRLRKRGMVNYEMKDKNKAIYHKL